MKKEVKMLRSILSLRNFSIRATDGEIGKVKDFYFDDQTWTLRYLVVETGNWLMGRKVLISTSALHAPDWNNQTFPVDLTQDQVKHSPDIDTEKPVTREQEADLHSHYRWPWDRGGISFLTTGMVGGVIAPDIPFEERIAMETNNDETPEASPRHLRSFRQLVDFRIRTSEDQIGELHDFLLNDSDWSIPYMIVEAGSWYSGDKLLAPTKFVDRIEWESMSVNYLKTTSSLKNAPVFDYDQLDKEDFITRYETSYTGNSLGGNLH
ncbi:PRC-barrel domain-containing protein [Desertivirga brevis]|uniref:PRC-barrel domain-containing protein n=1 Tax=Desertivirga brevis TaxID=2810310 RepID=UPI001A96E838|nr:PRC-barrel domain-containing protein [Pedobacter sp. SYSU D00873]